MGILDSLRGRRSRDDDDAGGRPGSEIGLDDPSEPDRLDFRPRSDGIYLCDPLALQFTGPRVREAVGAADPEGARAALSKPEVRSGEYTSSGRFSVSAPFEMLVTYTVIDVDDDSFVARRTDAGDRSTMERHFRFSPFPSS